LDWPAMSLSSSSLCGGDAGMRSVLWFRRDLRVEDNPALAAAARAGGEVVPAYVWSPEEEGLYFPGRVSRWSADAVVALLQLVRDTGAKRVYFNHLYGLVLTSYQCHTFVLSQFFRENKIF
jgi:cryptochrome 1